MASVRVLVLAVGVLGLCICCADGAAALLYDQDVTFGDAAPVTMLYGAGTNGGFTVDRRNGVEVGLRAQLRFDANNVSRDIYNSNGAGAYSFATGTPDLTKPHPDWATTTTPIWSVAFSVNTDYEDRDGTPAAVLSDYTYEVGLDFDPVDTGNWMRGDPISSNGLFATLGVPDHGFGLYTQQSPGIVVTTPADYLIAVNTCNIAQNITNYEFFNMDLTGFGMGDYSGFDPNQPGVYTVSLAAYSGTTEIARTQIQVWVGNLIQVPNVVGMMQGEAQTTLGTAGLSLGTITEAYDCCILRGVVISQYPAPTEGLSPGGGVDVIVSKGEAPKMPVSSAAAMLALFAILGGVGLRLLRLSGRA